MLIGDDPFIRIILKKLLSHFTFNVTTVSTLQQALEIYKGGYKFSARFSLIITDLSVSDIFSVLQTVKQFKAADSDVKVVAFCSQYNILKDKESCFDGVIGKSFSVNELAQVIKNVLSEGSTIEA